MHKNHVIFCMNMISCFSYSHKILGQYIVVSERKADERQACTSGVVRLQITCSSRWWIGHLLVSNYGRNFHLACALAGVCIVLFLIHWIRKGHSEHYHERGEKDKIYDPVTRTSSKVALGSEHVGLQPTISLCYCGS